jgi:hypothetical protein
MLHMQWRSRRSTIPTTLVSLLKHLHRALRNLNWTRGNRLLHTFIVAKIDIGEALFAVDFHFFDCAVDLEGFFYEWFCDALGRVCVLEKCLTR